MSKIYIALTESALDTIMETLEAYSVSSYFDEELRNAVSEAACSIETVTPIPAMLQALREIEALGASPVFERYETGKPRWVAREHMKAIATAAIQAAEAGAQ